MLANAEGWTVKSDWKPKTILIATDFSRSSLKALALTRRLALVYGAGIKLVHVFTLTATHRYAVPVEWMIEDLRKRAGRQLQQISRRLTTAGCSVETTLIETANSPATEILGAVAGCDDPLIVLGTHSRDRIERFLVGSTAEEVLRNTDCPVITVGPNTKGSSRHGALKRVLLATDLTERSFAAVPLLPRLLEKNAELTVVCVSNPEDAILGADWMDPLCSRITEELGDAGRGMNIRFEHYVAKNCAQKISEIARQHDVDLLLIGLHPGKRLSAHIGPKTGFQIIMSAPCPVLSVRS